MSDFKHQASESVSRQQAAERLTDLAYALAVGSAVSFRVDDRTLTIPVADELRLKLETKTTGDGVELELELSWPTPSGSTGGHAGRGA